MIIHVGRLIGLRAYVNPAEDLIVIETHSV